VSTAKQHPHRPGLASALAHRLVGELTLNIAGQVVGRLVAPRTVFFQGFHHDPVQLASQESRQFRRLLSSFIASAQIVTRRVNSGREISLQDNRLPEADAKS
jgi:hypothetical protein